MTSLDEIEKASARTIETAWGRRVVADEAWLLHLPTLTIGKAETFFDGVDEVYVSPTNGKAVEGPVVRLVTGHSFVANPNAFEEMAPSDVAFYRVATERFAGFMTGAVEHAAESGVAAKKSVRLLVSILRAQLRTLEPIMRAVP